MTIYNPFTSKFGYCELMYFNDVAGVLQKNHTVAPFSVGYNAVNTECGLDSTRTAQAWWLGQTAFLPEEDGNPRRSDARKQFGAEYGAAVLPQFIEPLPFGGVRFRWLLSTWNPYRVVVMQTDFRP